MAAHVSELRVLALLVNVAIVAFLLYVRFATMRDGNHRRRSSGMRPCGPRSRP